MCEENGTDTFCNDNDVEHTFFLSGNILYLERYNYLNSTNSFVALTDDSKVHVKNFYVKILPNISNAPYVQKMHDGFWLFMHVQAPIYDENKRWRRVKRNLQTFYNIRRYD